MPRQNPGNHTFAVMIGFKFNYVAGAERKPALLELAFDLAGDKSIGAAVDIVITVIGFNDSSLADTHRFFSSTILLLQKNCTLPLPVTSTFWRIRTPAFCAP